MLSLACRRACALVLVLHDSASVVMVAAQRLEGPCADYYQSMAPEPTDCAATGRLRIRPTRTCYGVGAYWLGNVSPRCALRTWRRGTSANGLTLEVPGRPEVAAQRLEGPCADYYQSLAPVPTDCAATGRLRIRPTRISVWNAFQLCFALRRGNRPPSGRPGAFLPGRRPQRRE